MAELLSSPASPPLAPPVPALPAWLVVVRLLAYYGFRDQVAGLLRRLSKASRAYFRSRHGPLLQAALMPPRWQDRYSLPRHWRDAGQRRDRYHECIAAAWDKPKHHCAQVLLQIANAVNLYKDKWTLYTQQDKPADFDWHTPAHIADPEDFWTTFVLLLKLPDQATNRAGCFYRNLDVVLQHLGLDRVGVHGKDLYLLPGGVQLLILSEPAFVVYPPNHYDALRIKLFATPGAFVVEQDVRPFAKDHPLFTTRRAPTDRSERALLSTLAL